MASNKDMNVVDGDKKNTKVVCCMDCFWANLIQYGDHDPVLAECRQRPQYHSERFPYEVMVASARWICPCYRYQDAGEKTVQKRLKVRHWEKAA